MAQVDDIEWIRLLYSYPNFLDTELLDLIANAGNICKYLDIPFQHISPHCCSACAAEKAAARYAKQLRNCVRQFQD